MTNVPGRLPARINVIGSGRSGLAAAAYLARHGVRVFISDSCPAERLEFVLAVNDMAHIPHESGEHTDRVLDGEAIVVSPGVDSSLPLLERAAGQGIAVWSEIELAYRVCNAPIVAVTGSSGKSTTVSLIGAVAEQASRPSAVGGNIGTAAISTVESLGLDGIAVWEISSFQLELTREFKPRVAAVLNLQRNHLDRYRSEEEYYNAKRLIARNLDKDCFLVLNADDPRLRVWGHEYRDKTNVVWFGLRRADDGDCVWIQEGKIRGAFGGEVRDIVSVDALKIRGVHNQLNAAAAAAVARCAGLGADATSAGLTSFPGLPHRLEFVARRRGVAFYNDSKSTTAESIAGAVAAFDGPVRLIAGGKDKGVDFSSILPVVRRGVRGAYLIGRAAQRIAGEWKKDLPVHRFDSLEEAVKAAYGDAAEGDVVVLSPGCSSFDMFRDFEHRGEVFRAIVEALPEERVENHE